MSKLMAPGKIGILELKNKIAMAPMGNGIDNISQRTIDFFMARVNGGVGMIMCNTMISEEFEPTGHSMFLTAESAKEFKRLCEEAHKQDCKVCSQLMPGCGRIGGPSPKYGVPISASACNWLYAPEVPCHELTKEEIQLLLNDFRRSAVLAIEAGADAIEIHSYGGYLTDQFLTAAWNTRTDDFGGDLEGRMKFLTDMVAIAKEVGGADYPVIVKYTPCHYLPVEYGFRGMEEGIEIAKRLEKAGVDALHVDAGCYENWYYAMPPVYFQEMTPQMNSAKEIRKHVNIPVITNGRLSDIEKAESALNNDVCDFVAIGRGLLADPDIAKKLSENRPEDIRPCISCNEGCIGKVVQGTQVECTINPFCGYEGARKINPVKQEQALKVLVVGAGPGGCTSALLAKQAGHQVEIWEKSYVIGGRALTAAKPYMKRDMEALSNYYKVQLLKNQIPVRFGTTADYDNVKEYCPDKVIWAAGAEPLLPKSIPGLNMEHVYTADDALRNKVILGSKIVIVGSGLVGVETALHLSRNGKDVTIVEMDEKVLPNPPFVMNDTQLRMMLSNSDITVKTGTKLAEVLADGIKVIDSGKEAIISCDNVLMALGYTPTQDIADKLSDICPVIAIGDSVKSRTILEAVHEAYQAVENLA